MDRQQIGMKLALEMIGLPIKLTSFDDRLILQKAVYLMQAAGVDLGYRFGWHLRGPYSPALTQDAFAVAAECAQGEDESRGWALDKQSGERLDRLSEIVPSGPLKSRSHTLECLASVHFLVREKEFSPSEPDLLERELHKLGKNFSLDEIKTALRELTHHGILK